MKIWAWGANSNGQLGLPFCSEQITSPIEVPLPPSLQEDKDQDKLIPLKITAGANDTILLASGLPNDEVIEVSPCFKILPYPKIKDIASGFEFSLYINSNGDLHSFGNNNHFQLGRSLEDMPSKSKNNLFSNDGGDKQIEKNGMSQNHKTMTNSIEWGPVPLPKDNTKHLRKVSAGMRHGIGFNWDDSENYLYGWGDNSKCQLGSLSIKNIPHPMEIKIPMLNSKSSLSLSLAGCGKDFTLILDSNGNLFGSGQNKFGVLLKEPNISKQFEGFQLIADKTKIPGEIKDIQCGWNHVLILLKDGKVVSWGRNDFGQLGRKNLDLKTNLYDFNPGLIEFPESIQSVACGSEHSLALGDSGKVYSWGWNEHANCGMTTITMNSSRDANKEEILFDNILFPVQVPFPEDVKISVIGSGAGSSFAVSF